MSLDLVLCSQGDIPCSLWIEVPEAGKVQQSPTQAAEGQAVLGHSPWERDFNQGQSHLRCHDLDGHWPSLTPSTLPQESHCDTNMFAQPKDKKGANGEGTCYRKQTQTIPRTKQWEAHRDTAQKPSPDPDIQAQGHLPTHSKMYLSYLPRMPQTTRDRHSSFPHQGRGTVYEPADAKCIHA